MRQYLFIVLMGVLLASCSPFTLVNSESYSGADLTDYHTFRIVTPADGSLPPGMEMVTYYNIAAAVREQMVERGYSENPRSAMLINLGITIHREIETEPAIPPGYPTYPAPPPPGPFYGYYPYFIYPRDYYWTSYYANAKVITGIYKEGVLTMDIVNIDKKIPLYSASVATIIDNDGSNGYCDLKEIADAVETLFSKFPVPLLPQYRNQK